MKCSYVATQKKWCEDRAAFLVIVSTRKTCNNISGNTLSLVILIVVCMIPLWVSSKILNPRPLDCCQTLASLAKMLVLQHLNMPHKAGFSSVKSRALH